MIAPKHEGSWTLDTLHEYLLALINANDRLYIEKFGAADKAVTSALASADRATEKAEAASEKRFEGVNEMRKMAEDNLRITMPRLEQEAVNKQLLDKQISLEKRLEAMSGQKSGSKEALAFAVAAIGVVFGLVSLVLGFYARKP